MSLHLDLNEIRACSAKTAQEKQTTSQAKYTDLFRIDLTESLSFLVDKVVSAKNQAYKALKAVTDPIYSFPKKYLPSLAFPKKYLPSLDSLKAQGQILAQRVENFFNNCFGLPTKTDQKFDVEMGILYTTVQDDSEGVNTV